MELQELAVLVQEAKKKKGRMDAAARERAAALISHIWSSEDLDPTSSLSALDDLQSEAIADGIGRAWSQMGESRRCTFLSWLPSPSSERASRRIALVAASVMDVDGRAAAELLCKLLPKGRKTLSKEARQILSTVLFEDSRLNFENLCQAGGSNESAVTLFSSLMDIAFDPTSDIGPVLRSRLAVAIWSSLDPLRDFDPQKREALQTRIEEEAKRWPSALREQFQRQLELRQSQSGLQIKPQESQNTAIGQGTPADIDITAPTVRGSILSQLSNFQDQLHSRLGTISNDLEYLKQISIVLTSIQDHYRAIETKIERTAEQASLSLERVRETTEANRRLENQLKEQAFKTSEMAKALDESKAEGEAERKRLSQQISANATGRIDEFKTRLGIVLARLVVDLPQRDVVVSAELGKVLLLQFHQFLEALRSEGIETRPRSAART
jgi:hypothetical protein